MVSSSFWIDDSSLYVMVVVVVTMEGKDFKQCDAHWVEYTEESLAILYLACITQIIT